MRLAAALAVLLVAGGVQAQPQPEIPTLSTDQVTRLEAGEILVQVVEARVPIGDTIGIVNAPPPQVLAVIEDFDNYPEFMPDTPEARIEGREGEFLLCRGVTDTPWPMEDREWLVRAWSGPQTIEGMEVLVSTWEYVPDSGNLVDTEGYWLLVPWGDGGQRTLVRYYLIVDLGTWIPDFLLAWGTEDLLPAFIVAIRERLGVD